MTTAIRVAQDLAATWERARPERRKELVAELFDTIRVGGGRIVFVKPKAAVMPLVAVTGATSKAKTGGPDRGLTRGRTSRRVASPSRGSRICWSSSGVGPHDTGVRVLSHKLTLTRITQEARARTP